MKLNPRFLCSLATLWMLSPAHAADPITPLPPVRVAPNGRTFVTVDPLTKGSKPFFWLGDTAWCIFNHPSPADVDLYLNDRQSKGFTVIQGCVAVWDFNSRPNPDGQMPFNNAGRGGRGAPPATNPQALPTINEAFYKNVDAIIDKCTARGMYMAILPFWTKNTRSGPFNDPAVMGPYCQFLAKRYAGKNVFFVLGGDTAGTDILPVINAEAEGLLKGAKDAGVDKIMITYHPTGRESSSFWFHEKPWLDFNSIQSGHFINTTNFQLVADDFNKNPIKPTLDMEPGYENITNNLVRDNPDAPRIQAVDVRRSAYLAVFAGAAGHTYGNGEVYEFYHPPANGAPAAGNAGWHAPMEWKDALKLPASGQVQFLRYLMESRPQERTPDQSLIVRDPAAPAAAAPPATAAAGRGRGGAGRENALTRIPAIRADDNSFAFIYLPTGQKSVTINTAKLSGNTLKSWWYDPRTGLATEIKTAPKTPTLTVQIPSNDKAALPAGTDDWVLVLDDAAKNFPAPGNHEGSRPQ